MKPAQIMSANQDKIISEYLAGKSTCELGRELGVSNGSIFLFLKKNNVEIRPTKISNKQKIIDLHKQGYTSYQIVKDFGFSYGTVARTVKAAGFDVSHRQKKREIPLTKNKEKIIDLYNAGIGTYTLGRIYRCQDSSIVRRLKKWGVQLRPLRRIAVDETFFDNIDSPEKAYILGWLMSDGSNCKRQNKFTLCITDLDILEEIAKILQYKGKIRMVPRREPHHKDQWRLQICSTKMSKALTAVGCVPRKTYCAKIPDLSEELMSHLIRGWSDGDGSIWRLKKKNRWAANICGTKDMCQGVANLLKEMNIRTTIQLKCTNEKLNHETYSVIIYRKKDLLKYLNWLYADSTIHLDRKYQKYQRFLAEYKSSEGEPTASPG